MDVRRARNDVCPYLPGGRSSGSPTSWSGGDLGLPSGALHLDEHPLAAVDAPGSWSSRSGKGGEHSLEMLGRRDAGGVRPARDAVPLTGVRVRDSPAAQFHHAAFAIRARSASARDTSSLMPGHAPGGHDDVKIARTASGIRSHGCIHPAGVTIRLFLMTVSRIAPRLDALAV